ncbi:hypothetical protein H5410_001496 [Solanum commersonii]|uniref:Uncharacterized protein n=1 Tax=Solanum commersonii TaxID=4109 RepID=A0A9J6AZU9_SOLCO|nr:hypothetical protein H5410_001496 [Solanum commersonii]
MDVVEILMMRWMREAILKWFGHVQRRCSNAPVRRCKRLTAEGTHRGRCMPKKIVTTSASNGRELFMELVIWDLVGVLANVIATFPRLSGDLLTSGRLSSEGSTLAEKPARPS